MSSNSFGRIFRLTTFGESHGAAIGVVIDGVPPRIAIDLEATARDLARRRPGQNALASPRGESDQVELLAGLFEGKTTGAPLALLVRNRDARPGDYERLRDRFRPGHADFSWWRKHGIRDHRGGGRSSGRETVARVVAGSIARQILAPLGVTVHAHVTAIGGIEARSFDLEEVERNPVRCGDAAAATAMAGAIAAARDQQDSLGGIVEIIADAVPAGWGDPVFDKLDARLAAALMSIGAVKGVEIGDGFALARTRGSEANDPFEPGFNLASNHAGGILGGISNGAPIVARIAVKPTSSIGLEQRTVDLEGRPTTVAVQGRHDPCITPRVVPVAEAMVALVLADAYLYQRALSGEG